MNRKLITKKIVTIEKKSKLSFSPVLISNSKTINQKIEMNLIASFVFLNYEIIFFKKCFLSGFIRVSASLRIFTHNSNDIYILSYLWYTI